MSTREFEEIENALLLLLWKVNGRDGEEARDFLRAYWGPDGDANFGAGIDLPGAVSTPSDDSTDPEEVTLPRSIVIPALMKLFPKPVMAIAGEIVDSFDGTGDGTTDGTTVCTKKTPEGDVPLCTT